MARTRVGLLGASGATGSSILEALIEDGSFDIIALARPASMTKPANITIKSRITELRALDLEASKESIVSALTGIEILISAIGPRDQLSQIPLVIAAKEAGIKRMVPCAFAPALPVGVHQSRDQKEQVFNLVKRLHLPYTIIDVGWWYQFALPALPSGKIDYALVVPPNTIPGDGNVTSAMTDIRDVGRYVVRAIKDPRTLNAMVFAYNELWTANGIYDLLENMAGEKIPRDHISTGELELQIADAEVRLSKNPKDVGARGQKVLAQYSLACGIRGENSPEFAKYLGYLDAKMLYPDLEFRSFESYVREVLEGKAKAVYGD